MDILELRDGYTQAQFKDLKQLMEYVLEQAKMFAPIELHLTSKPKRLAANKLYQSLGFQKKETNCYRLFLPDGKAVTAQMGQAPLCTEIKTVSED